MNFIASARANTNRNEHSEVSRSNCDTNLLTDLDDQMQAFQRQFGQVVKKAPSIKAIAAYYYRRGIQDRVLQDCLRRGGCTEKDIAQMTLQTITATGVPNAVGYGFLLAGLSANAALNASIMTYVNPHADFVSTFAGSFLGQMSFLSLSLFSVFVDPITSKIRRFAYANIRGHNINNGSEANTDENTNSTAHSDLETLADRTHAAYTYREQHASDRILMFRNALSFNLDRAVKALESEETDIVVAQLGDMAMMGYRHFKDLSPSDHTIANAIYSAFLVRVSNPQELYEPVIAYIQARDPSYSAKPKRTTEISAREYYELALNAWLRNP